MSYGHLLAILIARSSSSLTLPGLISGRIAVTITECNSAEHPSDAISLGYAVKAQLATVHSTISMDRDDPVEVQDSGLDIEGGLNDTVTFCCPQRTRHMSKSGPNGSGSWVA